MHTTHLSDIDVGKFIAAALVSSAGHKSLNLSKESFVTTRQLSWHFINFLEVRLHLMNFH